MDKHCLRALLIEDDPVDQMSVSRSLRESSSSIELVWAETLEDGLSRLADGEFDVVLTDLSLPDSSGLETVQRIRDFDQIVPIVVLTTLDDQEVERTSLAVGAQDYLIKGEATRHTLDRAIHHAIQRQESVVEIQSLLAQVNSSRKLLAEQKRLLKKKNEWLRRLNKTARRFVDNVSHEFRTPLTVIKDYISLVREGLVGEVNDEQCKMLDIAGVRTDELNNMVDDMLDVSRLESGMLGAWRRPCQLADIVESVCQPLVKKAAVKGIAFELDIEQTLPAVYCDAEKIGRVIINLVTNAMKFCGEPGAVRLWAQEDTDNDAIVVGVTDNGPGIDEEGVSLIFKRFQQLKTKMKSSTKGFGLGLNIAKQLVDLNFGEMSIESQLGQGTTFSFTVPLDNPQGVLTRYLERLHRSRNDGSVVACVRARIDESTADAKSADVFFNTLLRRNDLLFRVGTHNWLFVLPPCSDLAEFMARTKREWQRANRNRPFSPIPRFELRVEGVWDAVADSASILSHFARIMHPQVVCLAGNPVPSWSRNQRRTDDRETSQKNHLGVNNGQKENPIGGRRM